MKLPAWLDQPAVRRPTEVFVPVTMKVGPVTSGVSEDDERGWYGALEATGFDEPIWECDHVHPDQAAAWTCVDAYLREYVETQAHLDRGGEPPVEADDHAV